MKRYMMKTISKFANKKVLVLGLAKSGESAARLLDKLGAIVTVNDGKPFEENPAAQSLLEEGRKFHDQSVCFTRILSDLTSWKSDIPRQKTILTTCC